MNIFRILSSNDGSINEPNVSSFLAYMLNPNEDHGLSSLLLQELLNEFLLVDSNFLLKIQFENRIADLSKYSGYSVNIIPEMTVYFNNVGRNKRRDIDVLIEIIDNRTDEVLYAICLENKITDTSINKNDSQLEEELKGLKNFYHECKLDPEIYLLYITPSPSNISEFSFSKLDYSRKCHLYWNNEDNSLFNKLIKIFNDESNGLIDPINNQSSYLIKSFLSFIKTNFKSYIEERKEKLEKKSYGKPVIDHLKDFSTILEMDKTYSIKYIKQKFSDYVYNVSGIELNQGTLNAHIYTSIVNEKNRTHYLVKTADDERRNIFYYIDNSRKQVKIFHSGIDKDVIIYFKNEGEVESIYSNEIFKQTEK